MASEELRKRIDFLEETYEFLLSYAARGTTGDEGAGSEIRNYLEDAERITGELTGLFREAVGEIDPDEDEPYDAFADVLEGDAAATRSALRLVLSQPSISSQLVDNLNASAHFRALLTDLFLVDNILEARGARAPSG